jgi:hypothetical protein
MSEALPARTGRRVAGNKPSGCSLRQQLFRSDATRSLYRGEGFGDGAYVHRH